MCRRRIAIFLTWAWLPRVSDVGRGLDRSSNARVTDLDDVAPQMSQYVTAYLLTCTHTTVASALPEDHYVDNTPGHAPSADNRAGRSAKGGARRCFR